jgi:hypothetical protein
MGGMQVLNLVAGGTDAIPTDLPGRVAVGTTGWTNNTCARHAESFANPAHSPNAPTTVTAGCWVQHRILRAQDWNAVLSCGDLYEVSYRIAYMKAANGLEKLPEKIWVIYTR